MNGPGPLDYIDELHREATKIADMAKEAADSYSGGNPAGASLTLGLLHYRFDAAIGAGSAAMKAIRERDGVTPDDAIKNMGGE